MPSVQAVRLSVSRILPSLALPRGGQAILTQDIPQRHGIARRQTFEA